MRGPGLLQELYEESALTGGRDCCTWHTRPGRLERQHAPETRFRRALLAVAQAYILSQSLMFRFHYKTKRGQLPHRIVADPCRLHSRRRDSFQLVSNFSAAFLCLYLYFSLTVYILIM